MVEFLCKQYYSMRIPFFSFLYRGKINALLNLLTRSKDYTW